MASFYARVGHNRCTQVNTSSIYGAFNARWLSPEDVARAFVPTPHLQGLVRFQNSLLMGPRGCGKTTLLKMLTRPAQSVWASERVAREPELRRYPTPDFEAVYIPSDARWSYEVSSLALELPADPVLAERAQRAIVSLSGLLEATKTFQVIMDEEETHPEPLLKALISAFSFGRTVPRFADVRLRLLSFSDAIRSSIVSRDVNQLGRTIDSLPHAFTGQALDTLERACLVFEECAGARSQKRWALCFDELEIAPQWLQKELLRSLRSFDQHFLLKLTWSPVLPDDLEGPERHQDFATIRMWHAHAANARPFCKEFATRFIRDKLKVENLTPHEVFGRSPFGSEEDKDPGIEAYAPGTEIWDTMVDVAKIDHSFGGYLEEHGVDPKNPVAESTSQKDEVLRKAKPIVLLRQAYLKGEIQDSRRLVRRSRKYPTLYYGEDTIYSMSEGNPRLLAGLLDDLFDAEPRQLFVSRSPRLRPETQARVLFAASQRVLTTIKAYPVPASKGKLTLADLIDQLGNFLSFELVGKTFNADPVGSFTVDDEIGPELRAEIATGLLIGAFVHIGSTISDVPVSVLGSRLRLSHMLAPSYRLLFRNFRPLRLSKILKLRDGVGTPRFLFD